MLSEEVEAQLREYYLNTCEVLRHFWSCVPLRPETRDKLARMKHATDQISVRIRAIREAMNEKGMSQQSGVFLPLLNSLSKAQAWWNAHSEAQRAQQPRQSPSPAQQQQPAASSDAPARRARENGDAESQQPPAKVPKVSE
jgi:hypothetical protein